jgi:hypothetical protein
LMEDDDLIDAVDELWTEALFPQALPDQALDLVLIHAIELVQPARSDVTGHNDDRVLEIDGTPLTIGQPAIIKELQQAGARPRPDYDCTAWLAGLHH